MDEKPRVMRDIAQYFSEDAIRGVATPNRFTEVLAFEQDLHPGRGRPRVPGNIIAWSQGHLWQVPWIKSRTLNKTQLDRFAKMANSRCSNLGEVVSGEILPVGVQATITANPYILGNWCSLRI
jgi:hypothetical protein